MGWFVLAIFAALVLFVALGIDTKNKSWRMRPRQVLCILALLLIIPGCFATVPTGHTGILTTFEKVEDKTLEAGLHFIAPWQKVVPMDNRTQKATINMPCFSSDIQEVQVIYSINYQISKENAQNIYKSIGVNYYDTVIIPRIQQAVKSVIAHYTAESLVASRDEMTGKIRDALKPELEQYNIILINTAVENIDFSDAFTNAVEEKQVAEQQKLKAKTQQEQMVIEQTSKAERDRIAAQAAADVARIQAEAEKDVLQIQADAAEYAGKKDAAINDALRASLDQMLIRYYEIKQWDGKLPLYYMGDEGTVLPIIGSLTEKTETPAETPET
ncbi:MAG: prohibitin family protein [Clostridia bacterium]|nr:prohibitin family protein [Clostridia bacterium]